MAQAFHNKLISMRYSVQLGYVLQNVTASIFAYICMLFAIAANTRCQQINMYNFILGACHGYLLPTTRRENERQWASQNMCVYVYEWINVACVHWMYVHPSSCMHCVCGLLLEKGLQVSNLIEIIPELKWTLVQHSCFVNPISCMHISRYVPNAKYKHTYTQDEAKQKE